MAETDDKPETQKPEQPLKNDNAEVERLQKELEQSKMRANQLENEKAERVKQEEEAERKKLEEQNEFKTLAEREKERAEAAEKKLADSEKSQTLSKSTEELLATYPKAVAEIAKTTGLSLTEDSEDAKKAFTEKLDAIKKNVTNGQKVRGNNMRPEQEDVSPERALALKRMKFGDKSPANLHVLLKDNPALAQMRKDAGYEPES